MWAPYPSGYRYLIKAYRITVAKQVYIWGKRKENCSRMRDSFGCSFVVVVLAPEGPLVFFLVPTSSQISRVTASHAVDILVCW